MPVTGSLNASPAAQRDSYNSVYSHQKENASPGYYAVSLDRYAVDVELTRQPAAGWGVFDIRQRTRPM
jgi:putative alpha-1,2-mannosidase